MMLWIHRLRQLLRIGPRITKSRPDGRMPWSVTVVNINRMRARRRRQFIQKLLIIGLVFICLAANVGIWVTLYKQQGGPVPAAPAKKKPVITPTPAPAHVVPTPLRGSNGNIIIIMPTPTTSSQ